MTVNAEPSPLTPASQIPAALGPLANSNAANELEAAFQDIFLAVFERMLRPSIVAIETQAVAHRANTGVIRQAITADGLAMERHDAEEAHIRQLYRAWRARNPRRGLHFITQYLQLLWPEEWEVTQLWHAPDQPYPQGVSLIAQDGYYLTSRILVAVAVDDPTGVALLKLKSSFRSVLAARIVIMLALLRRIDSTESPLTMASVFSASQVWGAAYAYQAAKTLGVISGTVSFESIGIPNVRVDVLRNGVSVQTAQTSEYGDFVTQGIPAGSYTLQFNLEDSSVTPPEPIDVFIHPGESVCIAAQAGT